MNNSPITIINNNTPNFKNSENIIQKKVYGKRWVNQLCDWSCGDILWSCCCFTCQECVTFNNVDPGCSSCLLPTLCYIFLPFLGCLFTKCIVRSKVVARYGIMSECDCLYSTCCPLCAQIQEYKEVITRTD